MAVAALDLSRASVERLENGLTLIVLEEKLLPVVSVQMLYRVGARDEPQGLTGLAHYLEHMAFRATENFPDTQVVSAIYAIGGEWHGYTWLDQTTYFQTVPKEHLELVLRIEADRMQHLVIDPEEVELERGAVLAELHGYDDDPASVLHDAVLYTAFQAHPYRNNTIGWESDVRHIGHGDLTAFYRRHYHPANAVLVVVGDVITSEVRNRAKQLFGDIAAGTPSPPPHTAEPLQAGERRIQLTGSSDRSHFDIAYHAPAVQSADYPAFLVLQELLAGNAGVNFRQDNAESPVRDGAPLSGIADDLTTWFPPAPQPYVFSIAATVPASARATDIESAIESRIAELRDTEVRPDVLTAARARVLEELIFDVETTEDAAHQLAFFAGLDALDILLGLPGALADVTPVEVRSVARRYLQPSQRTVGWLTPSAPAADEPAPAVTRPRVGVTIAQPRTTPPHEAVAAASVQRRLRNGIPVIIQRLPFSPATHFRLVLRSTDVALPGDFSTDDPAWGFDSLSARAVPAELEDAIATARRALEQPEPADGELPAATDPALRLEQSFGELLAAGRAPARMPLAPALLVAVGDLDSKQTLERMELFFGGLRVVDPIALPPLRPPRDDVDVTLLQPKAQAQLGYIATAPGPREAAAVPWRLLLYILSHDYEGRLGREAIARRGLVYYIDSRYRSDGERAWISLSMGVDPGNLAPMQVLLREELERLQREPPTDVEIAEAKAHWLGRLRSAAQSNAEVSAMLAQNWLWHGTADVTAAVTQQLAAVRREDILAILPAFTQGAVVTVRVPVRGQTNE
jgi:zinc protease